MEITIQTEGEKNMNDVTTVEQNKWISKKELMDNLQCSSDTLERIIGDLISRNDAATHEHMKKGGYNNLQVFYDDYLVNMITAELAKHNTNQNTGEIQRQMNTQAKEQGILMNAVANSGDIAAAKALCNMIMQKTQLVASNKQLQQEKQQLQIENNELQIENQQLQQSLKYDKIKNWKRWSDLKDELKRDCEPFKHRINFSTVIDKSNLVENIDYIITTLLNDRFPAKMISPIGERNIHDTFRWY